MLTRLQTITACVNVIVHAQNNAWKWFSPQRGGDVGGDPAWVIERGVLTECRRRGGSEQTGYQSCTRRELIS